VPSRKLPFDYDYYETESWPRLKTGHYTETFAAPSSETISRKFVDAFFCLQPAGCLEGAVGVAFAVAGCVAQRDGVGGRVEPDFVRAYVGASAVGREIERAGIAGGVDFFGEFFQGAGGGVFFCGVVGFPSPRLRTRDVVKQRLRLVRLSGRRDSHRQKIGAIEKRGACGFYGVANLWKVIVPAGGAGDGADAESGETTKIFGSGGRRGELNRRGGTGEGFARE